MGSIIKGESVDDLLDDGDSAGREGSEGAAATVPSDGKPWLDLFACGCEAPLEKGLGLAGLAGVFWGVTGFSVGKEG
jgi:hypothetical protein